MRTANKADLVFVAVLVSIAFHFLLLVPIKGSARRGGKAVQRQVKEKRSALQKAHEAKLRAHKERQQMTVKATLYPVAPKKKKVENPRRSALKRTPPISSQHLPQKTSSFGQGTSGVLGAVDRIDCSNPTRVLEAAADGTILLLLLLEKPEAFYRLHLLYTDNGSFVATRGERLESPRAYELYQLPQCEIFQKLLIEVTQSHERVYAHLLLGIPPLLAYRMLKEKEAFLKKHRIHEKNVRSFTYTLTKDEKGWHIRVLWAILTSGSKIPEM